MAGAQEADVELMAAMARDRDPDALAELYDRYGGMAYGLSLRMLTDPGAAEEVIQEAFFNLWRTAASYSQERGSVRNWVLSIAHNQAVSQLRQVRSKQRLDTDLGDVAERLERPDIWGEVLADLDRDRIRGALGTLPREQRKTIELAYFGGYSHTEIAELLRVPLGTVKGRLRLGMDKLRAALMDTSLELSTD